MSVRSLAWLLALIMACTPMAARADTPRSAPSSLAAPAPSMPRGVVVVAAAKAPIDATWELASAVYRDPRLRPGRLDDATARALAGERPASAAPVRAKELFELRASLVSDGVSTRRLLGSVTAELGVSGALLVYRSKSGQARARLFVTATHEFAEPVLWPQPDQGGQPSWSKSVTWLASLNRSVPSDAPESKSGGNVLASPWFWGALAAVAGVVALGYAASRDDDPGTIHLQGTVNP